MLKYPTKTAFHIFNVGEIPLDIKPVVSAVRLQRKNRKERTVDVRQRKMTEERLKKRQVENGILAKAKMIRHVLQTMPYFPEIVSVYKRGDETKFIVTCGHPGMKRNADGKSTETLSL